MNTQKGRQAAPMLVALHRFVVRKGDPGLRSTTQRGCDNDEIRGKQLVPSRELDGLRRGLSGLWGTNRFWVVHPIVGGKPGENVGRRCGEIAEGAVCRDVGFPSGVRSGLAMPMEV